jgi:uncharacterized protein (DUF433 family)
MPGACIKGTRIMVSVILDNLASGKTTEQILESYPTLRKDDIRAAPGHASEMVREPVVRLPESTA